MNTSIKDKTGLLDLILKAGVVLSCCLGIGLHFIADTGGFMNVIFRAFTIQSNIWIALACLLFLVLDLKAARYRRRGFSGTEGRGIPQGLYIIKFMFTTSILLTYSVFAVLLSPTMNLSYLLSPSNLLLHTLTAVFALLDFMLFDSEYRYRKRHLWFVLIMPLGYAVYFTLMYEILGTLPIPYFFLDYKTYGWFSFAKNGIGSGYWIMLLAFALLGLGAAAAGLRQKALKTPAKTGLFASVTMLAVSGLTLIINALIH